MEAKDIDLVSIKTVSLREISVHQEFFDSLREDYKGFDQWYQHAAGAGRLAWVVENSSGKLDTLCIYKEESNGEAITDDGRSLPGKFLKMCTLKVTANGYHYGQRLLYASFQYALRNGLGHVYAQVRESKHEKVVAMLTRFGFARLGSYHADATYVKAMTPGEVPMVSFDDARNFNYCRLHYPYHLDGGAIRKFLVSLEPSVHEQYFIDSKIQRLPLELAKRGVCGEANAIRKAIVQSDALSAMRAADILFFYRQATDGTVRGFVDHLGVVESVRRYDQFEKIEEFDRECIPYPDDLLRDMFAKAHGVVFVFFWVIQRIVPGISRGELKDWGFDTHHRRVRRIPERFYRQRLKPRLLPYGVCQQTKDIEGRSQGSEWKGALRVCMSILNRIVSSVIKLFGEGRGIQSGTV